MKLSKSHLALAANLLLSLAKAKIQTNTYCFPESATRRYESAATTLPLLRNSSYPLLGITEAKPAEPPTYKHHCLVKPLGWGQDDSSHILAAVDLCGTDGIITLPAPYVYTISRRMFFKLRNAKLEIFGTLSIKPDLLYWIENSFRVEFQNQSAAWIVEGHNFEIDGGGWAQGGIDGNGQAWMTRAAGHSNQFGRPVPLAIFNSSHVTVKNFSIRDSPFWNIWIQDSSHVELTGLYVNGTNTDPAGNGSNFETNLDGLNTFRVDHLAAKNWVFRGGDDCLSCKSNSTNIVFENITCVGGGIAFGSLGQYIGSPDYVTNVSVHDVTVGQSVSANLGGANVSAAAYFKSWVGVSMGMPPQGGGGGTGILSNVTFDGLRAEGIAQAVYVNKCYFKVPAQAAYCDTSTYEFENLWFHNATGSVTGDEGLLLNCSAAAPCRDIHFDDVKLRSSKGNKSVELTCVNAENVSGTSCNSTLQSF